MRSFVFNSSLLVNHSSPGSRPLLWYEFEVCKESPHGFVFYYLAKVFNLMVGFPTNIMVLLQLARRKSDSHTSDIFIFNLAIVDAYFCLMTPIDMTNRLLLNNSHIWFFQNFAYGMKDTIPLFLTCICLDRYMAVVHPIVFSGIRDIKVRVAVSILVWGLMLANALNKSILGVDNAVKIYSGLILIVFTIMVFCNISIIWTLRKSVVGKEKMHPVKKKALRMVVFTPGQVVFSLMDLSCSIEPLLYISKMDHCTVRLPCSCCNSHFRESNDVHR